MTLWSMRLSASGRLGQVDTIHLLCSLGENPNEHSFFRLSGLIQNSIHQVYVYVVGNRALCVHQLSLIAGFW